MVADDHVVASSVFDDPPRKRHERRSSNSIVGRGGYSPGYAQIHPKQFTRDERIRIEFKKAVEEGRVEQIHAIFQSAHTKVPLQNREIFTLRRDVANIIKNKLDAAVAARVDPQYEEKPKALAKELKKAIDLANKQDTSFPYAKEVFQLKAYKECLDALNSLGVDQDGDLDSAMDQKKKSSGLNKSVSFEPAEETAEETAGSDDGF